MDTYLNGARIAYTEMVKVHMSTSDYVIDGEKDWRTLLTKLWK